MSAQPSLVCVVELMHDWRGVFLGQLSPIFSRVFDCASRDIHFSYKLVL